MDKLRRGTVEWWKKHKARKTWVLILAPLFSNYVDVGKLFNLTAS